MQLAAKQLLKLGVKPEVIVRHEQMASQAGLTLREHIQKLLTDTSLGDDPYRCNLEGCILEPGHPGEHVLRKLPADYWETAQ